MLRGAEKTQLPLWNAMEVTLCTGENHRNRGVNSSVPQHFFQRRAWDHLYSSVTEICTYSHEKGGQSLKVSLSPILLFVVLQWYQWVTVWAIVYKHHSAVFSWIKFLCFMEWSQTAEHWFLPIVLADHIMVWPHFLWEEDGETSPLFYFASFYIVYALHWRQ